MSKINTSIAPTVASIISRFAYLIFVISIGTYFGITSETDKVFLILAPISVLMSITLGVCDVIIIPLIHKSEKMEDRNAIVTKLLIYTLLFIPIAAIILLTSSWLNKSYSLGILFILLPIALLNAISSVFSNILCAEDNVMYSLLGPLYGAVVALVFVLFGVVESDAYGLCSVLLIYEVGRVLGLSYHSRIKLCFKKIGNAGNELLYNAYKNSKIQIVGAILMSLNPMIDIYFASTLNEGDSTSVEYVGRFWNMAYALFVGYLAMFYTKFSRQIVNNTNSYVNVHKKALMVGVIATLVSAIGVVASSFVIDIFYVLGGPGYEQKKVLAGLLQFYLLGTGPFVAGMLYVRAFSALDKIAVLTKVAAVFLLSNVILNYIFIKWFQVYGIAIATSVANIISVILFYYFYQKYFSNIYDNV